MSIFLDLYNMALRDGVYEVFTEATKTMDLVELKEKGYRVVEIPLSPKSSWDKLFILMKEKQIIVGCSLVLERDDFKVRTHTGLETKEVLRVIRKTYLGAKT